MALINIKNLTFSYDGSYDMIFENVSFKIDTDWKLGFVGRNGRGKTTFLNLLRGKYAYKGSIQSPVDFEYFPFEIEDKSKDTIQVIYSISDNFELWEIEKELSLLDVKGECLYRPFNTLSNGEQTKVLLCALFLKKNNFLLIDEPTNHLDIQAREVVSKYLKGKKGFILVSHDRMFLDGCVDHILSINRANIEVQQGNFSSWYYNKQMQDNFELEQNEKLKKSIKRLSETAREKAQWSDKLEATKIGTHQGDRGRIGHLAAKMMKRSKAIEKRANAQVEEKEKLLKNIEKSENLKLVTLNHHAKRLIECKNLALFYDSKQVCDNISFSLNQGDRIAITGKNGSGKSSLLKLIMGNDIKYTGQIDIAKNLIISYVSQDTSFLKGRLEDFIVAENIDETLFKSYLRKFDFKRDLFEYDMEKYSQGQKKKVLLAKSLCEKAHIYAWDEPLNYIDVLSRIQIEEVIEQYKPTIIFVEHDRAFCEKTATKKVCLD